MSGKSMFDELRQTLRELHDTEVIVGVQSEPGINFHGQTLSSSEEMQKIAWVHEYGFDIEVTAKMRAWLHYNGIHLKPETKVIHIPERSYLRRAKADGNASLNNVYSEQITRLFEGKITVSQLLDVLGVQMVTEVISSMGNGVTPVTQYTLDHRKESPNPTPLTDTGRLQNHVTYRVEKGGGKDSGTTIKIGGKG